MSISELLGRSATLKIRRFGSPGAFLALDDDDPLSEVILLLGGEIPMGATEGDSVDVFIHLDSEGRPIATIKKPGVERGEVAFLTAKSLTKFGAFFDWGLAKELLVPFAEQTTDVHVGARHPISAYIDKNGRLAGTMRVAEILRESRGEFALDTWVQGEAWRYDPDIGLFVIVDRRFVGLVPASEPHGLSRGDAARFRVSHVLPDGRIELSLRAHAHEEIEGDAKKILDALSRPNPPKVSDKLSPDDIRKLFGLSKKAFKRAIGRLLRERAIAEGAGGFYERR